VLNVAQPLVQAGLLGEAIDTAPALVFVADEDMQFVAVNETACRALGYEREALLGMRVTDVFRDPDAAVDDARMVAAGAATGSTELLCADGSAITFEYRATRATVAQLALYVSVGFAT
jgi:PAS domain S-box-containing protein